MIDEKEIVIGLLLYAALVGPIGRTQFRGRVALFAVLNVAFTWAIFLRGLGRDSSIALGYLAFVVGDWVLLRRFGRSEGRGWLWPLLAPIGLIVLVRYMPFVWRPLWESLGVIEERRRAVLYFVGVSYVAFRLSYAAFEVRADRADIPDFWTFLSFAFFVPVMALGPITSLATFGQSLERPLRGSFMLALGRIGVGSGKLAVIGAVLNQLGYNALVLDGPPHPRIDWLIAPIAYYLYLYCNFSGFSDIAIGTGALVGIRVEENFRYPLGSRNIREFWNRWHITLSRYFRDVVFGPLSKVLIRTLGVRRQRHAVALALFLVFALVGAWHGLAPNLLLYGALHGLAMVVHHYYDAWRKSRRRGAAKGQSVWGARVATASTFLFVAASLGVFANDRGLARTLEWLPGHGTTVSRLSGSPPAR